jgi:hypothetical protein
MPYFMYANRAIFYHPEWCTPALPRVVVTSTGFRAGEYAAACIRSVREQRDVDCWHVYFAADKETERIAREEVKRTQSPVTTIIQGPGDGNPPQAYDNLLPFWRSLEDNEIVIWLDGDDRLAGRHALAVVAKAHQDGAWVTYGQYIFEDGNPGLSYYVGVNPRQQTIGASHLKSFRAGLLKRMRNTDFLMSDGRIGIVCLDARVMFGVVEMAAERAWFIDRVLCIYNLVHSFDATKPKHLLEVQAREDARIRNFEPYARLAEL